MATSSSSCSSPPIPRPRSSNSSSRHHLRLVAPTIAIDRRRRRHPALRASALPETAAASALVAGLVGVAAATLLRGNGKPAAPTLEEDEPKREECAACGGTGLCPRCKGEGFVFKDLPEATASKARKAAKNMATRYTAGLPTKWTYCNRCSSTRSCTACGGSGTTAKAGAA